jgi:hypothetical protein
MIELEMLDKAEKLAGPNTLAYFLQVSVMKKDSFVTLIPGANNIKLTSSSLTLVTLG